MTSTAALTGLRFVCPKCRLPVRACDEAFDCERCRRRYPVRFGIPDFRTGSDRYLSLEQETAKAVRLAEAAGSLTFEQLLDHYYRITDDVPAVLAARYRAAIVNSERHLEALAADLAASLASRDGALALDAGCGAGGMLVAARRLGVPMVGIDIALRWLVICRKRLDELGLDLPLVCADVAEPPFSPGSFDAIAAIDLVEHVPDVRQTLCALAALAKPAAPLWVTSANGRTLGPHPSTRLWAIGWLPSRLRRFVVRKLRGIDSLRYTHLLSLRDLQRLAASAGLLECGAKPRRMAVPDYRYPLVERVLMHAYRRSSELPVMKGMLLRIGPSFEMLLRRRPEL